ncbi:MAG TPA: hypothetical protein VF274_10400 [Alphaproteobacteria bacterium]|jgi:hypothetical protein
MSAAVPTLYLLDVPEFQPAAAVLANMPTCRLTRSKGYVRIESDGDIVVERKDTRMNEAVWFGLTVAGFDGVITEFTSDRLRITGA